MAFPSVRSYANVDPITSLTIAPLGAIFHPPQANQGPLRAGWIYNFYATGTSTPVNVYQDGALTVPFAPTGQVTADGFGRFPAIYLDNSVAYKVTLSNVAATVQQTRDPYNPAMATTGFAQVAAAIGPVINAQGEITLTEAGAGGSGIELSITAGLAGALKIQGISPGVASLIVDSTVTTGAQTATFAANNKPGSSITVVATVAPSGATYTGGTLTTAWTGATASNYTLALGNGLPSGITQYIQGATFTNGSVTFTVPSTSITGTPSATLLVQPAVSPAGWLPIQADGVTYYTPIWFDNPFTPYVFRGNTINGQIISASGFEFNGNGSLTLSGVGATATPPLYYAPPQSGIGSSLWFEPTITSGLAGQQFINSLNGSGSNLSGVWTNIGAGLNVGSNSAATLTGTYQLSTSSGGTPVVANGTITLSGGNGAQEPTINNGALTFNTNGTITALGGTAPGNYFLPTTGGIGTSYWLFMAATPASSVGSLGGITDSVYTQLSSALNVYGIAGSIAGNSAQISGTYKLSTSNSDAGLVATGAFQLQNVGLANIPLGVNNGSQSSAIFKGSGAAVRSDPPTVVDWYSSSVTGIGASYWVTVNIISGSGTLTGITPGTPTNIGSGGLTITSSGTVGCSYTIAANSGGSPILCEGFFGLTAAPFGGQTDTFATAGTFTETIPTGASQLVLENWGGSGGGGAGQASSHPFTQGGGGGSGGYNRVTLALSSADWGKTIHVVIGAAATAGANGGASTISSGTKSITTLTANGGHGGGANGGAGAGGTASGGTTNTTGNAGGPGGTSSGTGGAGVVGVNGTGNNGGNGTFGAASVGAAGLAIFTYT